MDYEARSAYVTRKQINVIFMNAKKNLIHVEKGFMAYLYGMTECSIWTTENERSANLLTVRAIIDAIFAGDMEEAQKRIDEETENYKSLLGKKGLARYSCELV